MNSHTRDLWGTLIDSSERIHSGAQAGQIDAGPLRDITEWEAELAPALTPMPINPVQHLQSAHEQAGLQLGELYKHDPHQEVAIGTGGYTYTPRKVLRRVLDHALDHLNQIEQWLIWQQKDVRPDPTDGWAPSAITLAEDKTSLDRSELQSWLWRIDLVINMVIERAGRLNSEQLNWKSPDDDGWTIAGILHHLAAAETFYVAWLDHPLPQDPVLRYAEANSRLQNRLLPLLENGIEEGMAFWGSDIDGWTPEQVASSILEKEQALQVNN